MADVVDLANDHLIEAERIALLEQQRKPRLLPTGRCLSCEEPVPPDTYFCDYYCREDHERETRMNRISGKS